MAVETKVFPLYEVMGGEKIVINHVPKGIPVKEYLQLQGRFSHLSDDEIAIIQRNTDESWQKLMKRAGSL